MKKILAFVSVLALTLGSCNKDDDNTPAPSAQSEILGQWKYLKEGMMINGEEMMSNYEHTPGCNADFLEFKTGSVVKDYYYEQSQNQCEEIVDVGTWSKSGNMLTATIAGESNTAEIIVLNSTTLKIKYSFPGEGEVYIDEWVRQ